LSHPYRHKVQKQRRGIKLQSKRFSAKSRQQKKKGRCVMLKKPRRELMWKEEEGGGGVEEQERGAEVERVGERGG